MKTVDVAAIPSPRNFNNNAAVRVGVVGIKRKTMYEDYEERLPETKRENCFSKVAFFNEIRAVLTEKTIKGIR
ncbi:hypothetical protein HK104_005070, partial [Borealophlyctis nickersoniae]